MPVKGRTREDLQDAAAELKGAGLSQVAAILTDLSSNALPMTDWSFCCYTADVLANQKSWLRAQQQRQAERAEQRKRWAMPPTGPRKTKAKP